MKPISATPTTFSLSRRQLLVGGIVILGGGYALPAEADDKPTGTIDIEQWQVAFIGSGNLGGGKLHFQGKTYSFTVGGLGIGGFGVSKMEAYGTVFNLTRLVDFPGAYVQARYGAAVGPAGNGQMFLKNANNVGISLRTKREGLALSLGGDAVYINVD
jgi:hypothetical protein